MQEHDWSTSGGSWVAREKLGSRPGLKLMPPLAGGRINDLEGDPRTRVGPRGIQHFINTLVKDADIYLELTSRRGEGINGARIAAVVRSGSGPGASAPYPPAGTPSPLTPSASACSCASARVSLSWRRRRTARAGGPDPFMRRAKSLGTAAITILHARHEAPATSRTTRSTPMAWRR